MLIKVSPSSIARESEVTPESVYLSRRTFMAGVGAAAALAGLPLRMNPEPAGTSNGYWMPTIVVDEGIPFDREALLADFKADNIDGRVFFWPLSSMPMFANSRTPPRSGSIGDRALNLPSYHELNSAEQARVCNMLHSHLRTLATSEA